MQLKSSVDVYDSLTKGYCLQQQQLSANFSPRRVPSLIASCQALRFVLQQCLYRGCKGPAQPSPASQSKREARHLRCILPGNMPAEKEDKQEEEEEEEEEERGRRGLW